MDDWIPYLFPALFIAWIPLSLVINRYSQKRTRHCVTETTWDDRIPFLPIFAAPYLSAYVLGPLGYVLVIGHSALPQVFRGYLYLVVVAILSYVLLPSRVNRRERLPISNPSTYLLATFQRISAPYNSFPCMHMAFCLLSAFVALQYHPGWIGPTVLAWALLVGLSTLPTKQHTLIDVGAGVFTGVAAYALTRL